MKALPKKVRDKAGVALVTGAADRIGAAIAERLAGDGWRVVIHYRASKRKAEATLRRIEKAGGQAALIQADLADRTQRANVIADAAKPFGPLTLLVNNASIFEKDSAADLDEVLWDTHFAVHAEAPAFLSRDFAAQLPARAKGNIINIIDERVLHLTPDNFSYTLSKVVLHAMTRTLAQSFAPRIRVNAIGPGPTIMEKNQSKASFAASQARLPLKQGAGAGGVADGVMAILGLTSMTGQMLALDGGEHIEWPDRRRPTPRTPSAVGPEPRQRRRNRATK